jgi:photosystem II stability/assembly factor-like uncharacterized protein
MSQFVPTKTLYLIFLTVFLPPINLTAQEAFWQSVDGPYGLYLSALVETHDGELLAASSLGIFQSTNHGIAWNHNPLLAYVNAILITKRNSILLGINGGPSLKSVDNGTTWRPVKGDGIDPICCDSAGNIYAINRNLNSFIWRSSDEGESWKRIDPKTQNQSFYTIITDFRGNVYAAGFRCIVKSTDNGLNWETLSKKTFGKTYPDIFNLTISKDSTLWAIGSSGMFTLTNDGQRSEKVMNNLPEGSLHQLLFTKSGSMFVWGYFKGSYYAVLKSNDQGKSWVEVFRSNRTHHISSMILDASGDVFVAGTEIYRSTDEGLTWSKHSKGLTNDGMRAIGISSKGSIFAGTFWNLFKSSDNGASWIQIDSAIATYYRWFNVILPFSDSVLFVGNGNDGIFVSTDVGTTWHASTINQSIISILRNRKGKIFVATSSGFYTSADTGKTWTNVYGLDFVNDLTINSNGVILAATGSPYNRNPEELFEVYRSAEDTLDWLVVNPDSSNNVSVIPSSGKTLFIKSGGLLCSYDDGVSWHHADATAPTSVKNIVETRDGLLFAVDEFTGVYKSSNKGISWRIVNNGLVTGQAYQLALHPDGYLYVGTRYGLFRSIKPVVESK